MVGAALAMTYAGFWYEATRSKKEFLGIFAGVQANQEDAPGLTPTRCSPGPVGQRKEDE